MYSQAVAGPTNCRNSNQREQIYKFIPFDFNIQCVVEISILDQSITLIILEGVKKWRWEGRQGLYNHSDDVILHCTCGFENLTKVWRGCIVSLIILLCGVENRWMGEVGGGDRRVRHPCPPSRVMVSKCPFSKLNRHH